MTESLSAAPPPAADSGSDGPRVSPRHAARRVALSLAVAAMGVVDLLSALLSHPPERLVALRHLVPTDVLDTSRTFTLLAGALLLVTAWGLRRGKRRAFVWAMWLCAISVPVNLLKAFDFEEATVATALLLALGLSGEAFRVSSRALSVRDLRSGTALGLVGLLVYAAVGSWVLEASYGHQLSWASAFAEAWQRLSGTGEPVRIVPPGIPGGERRVLVWFLRSLPLLSLTLVLGSAVAALRPASHRRRHRLELDRVAELLRTHGASSVSAFVLGGDADYFFSRNQRSVIGYRFESDVLLGIGDPVGPLEELRPLLIDFQRFCQERDWAFAFFQARPEFLSLYRGLGWRALPIGVEPVLHTDRFTLEGATVGDARRQTHKAERLGLVVRHFPPGEFDPAHRDREWFEQLRHVSSEWLAGRVGAEKGFCMGRFDATTLRQSWLAVAWDPGAGRVEGFVTWVPVWARRGWALDLMRRRADAAAGTMEMLIVHSVAAARERGDALLSLALSPLADPERSEDAADPDLSRARAFLRRHLARFYDFEGLFRWKNKFAPVLEERYLVHAGPLVLPRVAMALARAQSPGGWKPYWTAWREKRRG